MTCRVVAIDGSISFARVRCSCGVETPVGREDEWRQPGEDETHRTWANLAFNRAYLAALRQRRPYGWDRAAAEGLAYVRPRQGGVPLSWITAYEESQGYRPGYGYPAGNPV